MEFVARGETKSGQGRQQNAVERLDAEPTVGVQHRAAHEPETPDRDVATYGQDEPQCGGQRVDAGIVAGMCGDMGGGSLGSDLGVVAGIQIRRPNRAERERLGVAGSGNCQIADVT